MLVRSYRTVSPLPFLAVCSLWHFPASHLGLPLAITLLCEVRTFLESLRGRPANSFAHTKLPDGCRAANHRGSGGRAARGGADRRRFGRLRGIGLALGIVSAHGIGAFGGIRLVGRLGGGSGGLLTRIRTGGRDAVVVLLRLRLLDG